MMAVVKNVTVTTAQNVILKQGNVYVLPDGKGFPVKTVSKDLIRR